MCRLYEELMAIIRVHSYLKGISSGPIVIEYMRNTTSVDIIKLTQSVHEREMIDGFKCY